jgi:hypothetical protein
MSGRRPGPHPDEWTVTEYWLMYERQDGEVRRWLSFSSRESALGAIESASDCVRATRWGVRVAEVTRRTSAIEWTGESS